jgi:large subunit ribosomal protein L21
VLDVDLLDAEVGARVDLSDVLLVSGGADVRVGTPLVSGARVVAEVVEHSRDKKIGVFKYKNKTRYRRRHGHRQHFTRLQIREILAEGIVIDAAEEKKVKPARKKAAPKAEAETEGAVAKAEAEVTAEATEVELEAPEAGAAAEPEAAVDAAPEAPEADATAEKPKRGPRKAAPRPEASDKPAPKPRSRKKTDSGE